MKGMEICESIRSCNELLKDHNRYRYNDSQASSSFQVDFEILEKLQKSKQNLGKIMNNRQQTTLPLLDSLFKSRIEIKKCKS